MPDRRHRITALLLAVLLPLTLIAGRSSARSHNPAALAVGVPFSIMHTPAAGTQATITQAAASGVRNIVETVSFGFSATTALGGITTVTINLRDGATGAGTILQSWQYTLPAATVAPFNITVTGLHIQGTANTATTLEFSASVGNLMEYVSLNGYTSP